MKFFIDNNLPPKIAKALDELCKGEHSVEHLRSRFPAMTSDVEWIEALASEGDWVVITQDRLRKGDQEKEAVRRSGLVVFVLDKQWAKLTFWEKAHRLVQWWPPIIDQSEKVFGGAAFRVPLRISGKGKFEQLKY